MVAVLVLLAIFRPELNHLTQLSHDDLSEKETPYPVILEYHNMYSNDDFEFDWDFNIGDQWLDYFRHNYGTYGTYGTAKWNVTTWSSLSLDAESNRTYWPYFEDGWKIWSVFPEDDRVLKRTYQIDTRRTSWARFSDDDLVVQECVDKNWSLPVKDLFDLFPKS
jgi:hypothetical protein